MSTKTYTGADNSKDEGALRADCVLETGALDTALVEPDDW
jgi:hypothetical protein